MNIYALKDEQASCWLPGTFMAPNDDTAMRSVSELALQQPNIPPFKYPDVFRIYKVGTFDEMHGFDFEQPLFVGTVEAVLDMALRRRKEYRAHFLETIQNANDADKEQKK
uniref:Nonstructural protein n=1 Tax=Dulem virus 159 TaxID=3145636 RepID=A0AAU8B6W7_9VIRU